MPSCASSIGAGLEFDQMQMQIQMLSVVDAKMFFFKLDTFCATVTLQKLTFPLRSQKHKTNALQNDGQQFPSPQQGGVAASDL